MFGPVDCGVIDGTGRNSEAAETGFAALRGSGPLSHVAVEALAEVYARNKISRERRQLKKTTSAAAGRTASFSEHPTVPAGTAITGSGAAAAAVQAPLAEAPVVEISPREAETADAQMLATVAAAGGGDGTAAASGALAGATTDSCGDVGGFDIEGLHYADFELGA